MSRYGGGNFSFNNNNPSSPTPLADFSANGLIDSSSGILQRALELSKKQQSMAKPVTTVRFVEQADIVVPQQVDMMSGGSSNEITHRPATLRCGELVPYSQDELVETKDSEFSFGRRIHIYRGQLRPGSDLREGKGVFQYADGEVYIGDFRTNKRNGYGVFLVPTGYGFEGHFKDDKPQGAGRELFPDGSTLIGNYLDGLPTGLCVLSTPRNGSIFVGNYNNDGERHGLGTIIYDNGDVVQGTWSYGKREGVFKTYYNDKKRLYATQWTADTADTHSKFMGDGEVIKPQLPDLNAFPLLPAPDLRAVGIIPDLVTDVHPLLVMMLKEGFEALDVEMSGTVELAALREQWITDAANSNARRGMAASLRAYREADTTEFLSKLELATKNGLNVDFAEVLCVCFSHIPATEVKRWASADLTPEALLRLRGSVGGVATKAIDTWNGLSSSFSTSGSNNPSSSNNNADSSSSQSQKPVSLMQMFIASMPTLGGAIRLTRCLFLRSACHSMKQAPGSALAIFEQHQQSNSQNNNSSSRHHNSQHDQHHGNHQLMSKHQMKQHFHHQASGRVNNNNVSILEASNNNNNGATAAASSSILNSTPQHGAVPPFHIYTPYQLNTLRITFSDLLAQVFPLTTADERFRVTEMETVPEAILQHYAMFFDTIDTDRIHHLSIEHLKGAQQKYRSISSASGGVGGDLRSGTALKSLMIQERLKSFPLAEYFAKKQQEKEDNAKTENGGENDADGNNNINSSFASYMNQQRNQQSGYEARLQPHAQLPWNARWVLLDINLTVSSAKLIDKQRTGYISLAEILRFCYPSVPCAWTRDRLSGKSTTTTADADGKTGGADGSPGGVGGGGGSSNITCRCSICRYCGARYTKSKPPNPYMENPNAIW